jgi:hypothetical protein
MEESNIGRNMENPWRFGNEPLLGLGMGLGTDGIRSLRRD